MHVENVRRFLWESGVRTGDGTEPLPHLCKRTRERFLVHDDAVGDNARSKTLFPIRFDAIERRRRDKREPLDGGVGDINAGSTGREKFGCGEPTLESLGCNVYLLAHKGCPAEELHSFTVYIARMGRLDLFQLRTWFGRSIRHKKHY